MMWGFVNWAKGLWHSQTPAQADMQAALAAAGLASKANALIKLRIPSIRIRTERTQENTLPIGDSKLGGRPDLPAHTLWPSSSTSGAPLAFIAQVRLEQAHPYDVGQLLPASGLLSFFYDAQGKTFGEQPTDRGNWQVLFYNGDVQQLHRANPPAALPSDALHPACSITFATEWTLPLDPTQETADEEWTPEERSRYEQFLATYPTPADHATLHHRLLGYADTLQDDMRAQCQLMANGVSSINGARAASLLKRQGEWQLLLQIDSDENAQMRWGNNGMLYYWIEGAKLRRREFDNVWLVLQSE